MLEFFRRPSDPRPEWFLSARLYHRGFDKSQGETRISSKLGTTNLVKLFDPAEVLLQAGHVVKYPTQLDRRICPSSLLTPRWPEPPPRHEISKSSPSVGQYDRFVDHRRLVASPSHRLASTPSRLFSALHEVSHCGQSRRSGH